LIGGRNSFLANTEVSTARPAAEARNQWSSTHWKHKQPKCCAKYGICHINRKDWKTFSSLL